MRKVSTPALSLDDIRRGIYSVAVNRASRDAAALECLLQFLERTSPESASERNKAEPASGLIQH